MKTEKEIRQMVAELTPQIKELDSLINEEGGIMDKIINHIEEKVCKYDLYHCAQGIAYFMIVKALSRYILEVEEDPLLTMRIWSELERLDQIKYYEGIRKFAKKTDDQLLLGKTIKELKTLEGGRLSESTIINDDITNPN